MKKIFRVFFLGLFLLAFVITSIISNENFKSSRVITRENNIYLEENTQEENLKIFLKLPDGSMVENNYTKENPYVIPATSNSQLGATLDFVVNVNEDDYDEVSKTLKSTVYNNDYDQNTKHILNRTQYDTWNPTAKTLTFGFKSAETNIAYGYANIAIRNDDDPWGSSIDSFTVLSVKPNVIYIKDNLTGEYKEASSEIEVEEGEEVELLAALTGITQFTEDGTPVHIGGGSGFFNWNDNNETANKSVWELRRKITNTNQNWVTRVKVSVPSSSPEFNVILSKNNNLIGSIRLLKKQNKIKINDIKVGDKEYDNLDKNIITRMFNGVSTSNNSSTNRYVVYVGDTLNLSAKVENQQFGLSTSNGSLTAIDENKFKNGNLTASYIVSKPGPIEVQLKNDSGVIETFYVLAKYPINVVTSLGEYRKDNVHEYVDTALAAIRENDSSNLVVDPENNPLYVKNGPNNKYDYRYLMATGDSIVLTTYQEDFEASKFVVSSGLEIVELDEYDYPKNATDYQVIEKLDGDMSKFKKVTAKIKAKAQTGTETVRFTDQVFYIGIVGDTRKSNHFDLEINDGGTYTTTEIIKQKDGSKIIEQIVYNAVVYKVHGSKVYGVNDTLLAELSESEYWVNDNPKDTQFESTSAYITNKDGKLIKKDGTIIEDEDFINGKEVPQVKDRDVKFSDIESVVFTADARLIPMKKTTIKVNVDNKGNEIEEDPVTTSLNPEDIVELNNIEITMNEREILDAINKCPDHSGLDFTTKLSINIEKKLGNLRISKVLENGNKEDSKKEFKFTITLKDSTGNIATNVNGEYGDVIFINGVAKFTLKDGMEVVAMNIPAGLSYKVEETKEKNFMSNATNASGVIVNDKTIDVKFVNTKGQVLPATGQNWTNVIAFLVIGFTLVVFGLVVKKNEKKN